MRTNADYVLSRRPDYVMIQDPDSPRKRSHLPASIEISEHPDFQQDYEKTKLAGLYRRKDLPPATQERRFQDFWNRLLVPLAECDVPAAKNDAITKPGTRAVVKDNVWRTGLPGEPLTK